MPKNRAPYKIFAPLLALLLILTLPGARVMADELVFTNDNFAFTPPASWMARSNPAAQPIVRAVYASPDKSQVLVVMVENIGIIPGPVDETFMTGFERGIEKTGASKPTWGKYVDINGVKAYQRLGKGISNKREVSLFHQIMVADGKCYIFRAQKSSGTAGEDPDLQKSLASFRYLTPPAMNGSVIAGGSPAFREGYKIGYQVGRYMMAALLVLGVIIVIFVIARIRSQPPKNRPPPLPPNRGQ